MTSEYYLDGHPTKRPIEPEDISRLLAERDWLEQKTLHSLGAPALTLTQINEPTPQLQQKMEKTND